MAPETRLEPLFRALADETRLRILALLASSEVCVCNIHDALGIPQPTASRHLAYLRRVGLVATRRQGLWVHYRLAVPEDPERAAILRATVGALGSAARTGTDRERLSAITSIPLRSLVKTAESCCARPTSKS
jgi:ArsR family transcriptional regulator